MSNNSGSRGGNRGTNRSSGRNRRRGGSKRRGPLPKVQRVGAYAVILRGEGEDQKILLSRLADKVSESPLWTLPGGGVEHGEDPRKAVEREVYEETGLPVEVGETAWIFSVHQKRAWRMGKRIDSHALRIVYDGWVPVDAPEPQTTEVDGSTAEAAWIPLADVLSGETATVLLVREALKLHRPPRLQRVAAYAWIVREDAGGPQVLLTQVSQRGHHSGMWTLPGGGIDFAEGPREALVREVREETGLECTVGEPLAIDDIALTGTAPSGRHEEFHGVHLVFDADVAPTAQPRVVELDGTTSAVGWFPVEEVRSGLGVLPVVRSALAAWERRTAASGE